MDNINLNLAKRLLNKELDKCTALLKENEEKWNSPLDLKLHDICTYGDSCDFDHNGAHVHFTEKALQDYFELFCAVEYEFFINWCDIDEGIDFEELRQSIGRTSKFYLGSMHNNYKNKYTVALAEVCDAFNMSLFEVADSDGKIVVTNYMEKENDIDCVITEALSLAECVYEDLKNEMDDIIKVYDYIKDFKANQVECFKDFVKENWLANA